MNEIIDIQIKIKFIKDQFEDLLAKKLNLVRVSAPLFVKKESGLNDYLSGKERVISFDASGFNLEIVQSLAKWKRNALVQYDFPYSYGLYTDMNAIRRDEKMDNIHSIYVDQWDWEKLIKLEDRNEEFLFQTVKDIYSCLLDLNQMVNERFGIDAKIPEDIHFISSEELLKEYPNLSSKERENEICRRFGAVFISHIGDKLANGKPHDDRAADYDDWHLNGDILLYNPVLDSAFEISSMGIRVIGDSLVYQLHEKGEDYKLENQYAKDVISGRLKPSIGGGIGQSRLCMFFLKKEHIGQVQSSIWDEANLALAKEKNIYILWFYARIKAQRKLF